MKELSIFFNIKDKSLLEIFKDFTYFYQYSHEELKKCHEREWGYLDLSDKIRFRFIATG
jgi:hypothetical protein